MKRISTWTEEEDQLLLKLYNQVGNFQRWKLISNILKERGIVKKQTECRERFVNKLDPSLRQDKLEACQLKALFKYYDEYGPQWSVFESLIPGRNQNLLKNKFYSTLRTIVRLLLISYEKREQTKSNFSSASLSSKILVEIYEGKKAFRKFKGALHSLLKKISYDLQIDPYYLMEDEQGQQIICKIRQEICKEKQNKARESLKKKSNSSLSATQLDKNFNQTEKNQNYSLQTLDSLQHPMQKIDPIPLINFNLMPLDAEIGNYPFFPTSTSYTFLLPMWNYEGSAFNSNLGNN